MDTSYINQQDYSDAGDLPVFNLATADRLSSKMLHSCPGSFLPQKKIETSDTSVRYLKWSVSPKNKVKERYMGLVNTKPSTGALLQRISKRSRSKSKLIAFSSPPHQNLGHKCFACLSYPGVEHKSELLSDVDMS
jgi:hypothetical protein